MKYEILTINCKKTITAQIIFSTSLWQSQEKKFSFAIAID